MCLGPPWKFHPCPYRSVGCIPHNFIDFIDFISFIINFITTHIGLQEPRLVELLATLLSTHAAYFQRQRCRDRFEGALGITALRARADGDAAPPRPPPGRDTLSSDIFLDIPIRTRIKILTSTHQSSCRFEGARARRRRAAAAALSFKTPRVTLDISLEFVVLKETRQWRCGRRPTATPRRRSRLAVRKPGYCCHFRLQPRYQSRNSLHFEGTLSVSALRFGRR